MAAPRRDLVVLVFGSVLLLLYAIQARLGFEWTWLLRVQSDDTYKLVSGGVLAAYLAYQWSRRADPFRHRLVGAFAPVVLYAHSARSGYGYLVLLCAVYLGTAIAGLLHQPVIALRRRWLFTTWFLVHVTLATALIVLAAYHVAIAIAYE
jgi:hypothetical protein